MKVNEKQLNQIFNLIQTKIPAQEFSRYIKRLKYVYEESKEDLAVFVISSPLLRNWIKTNYTHIILHCFEQITGKNGLIQIKNNIKENNGFNDNNAISSKKNLMLLQSHTFDNFVSGKSNEFAYSVAKHISHSPGDTYNPFFIYGGVGLGKTHLAQAIGNEVIKKLGSNVIYKTSEQFLNDLTRSIRDGNVEEFRTRYRNCDILIIDDIQFFSNKEQTQEEFFHTFNELYNLKKHIILTADKEPKNIIGLESRLKSRFESGIIADIKQPELETKIAIIEKKCFLYNLKLQTQIIEYIATQICDNVREIEGILQKILAHSNIIKTNINLDLIKSILKENSIETNKEITEDKIIKFISGKYNIKISEIKSKSKKRDTVQARRTAIYFCQKLTGTSALALAKEFGLKDHTAISKAKKEFEKQLSEQSFKIKINELENKIKNNLKDN